MLNRAARHGRSRVRVDRMAIHYRRRRTQRLPGVHAPTGYFPRHTGREARLMHGNWTVAPTPPPDLDSPNEVTAMDCKTQVCGSTAGCRRCLAATLVVQRDCWASATPTIVEPRGLRAAKYGRATFDALIGTGKEARTGGDQTSPGPPSVPLGMVQRLEARRQLRAMPTPRAGHRVSMTHASVGARRFGDIRDAQNTADRQRSLEPRRRSPRPLRVGGPGLLPV